MAVASAGRYANNLHLAPDSNHTQHLMTQFLQARWSSAETTMSSTEGKQYLVVINISIQTTMDILLVSTIFIVNRTKQDKYY